jgi:hypothetical protein
MEQYMVRFFGRIIATLDLTSADTALSHQA